MGIMGMNFRILESYVIMCKKLNLESTWTGLNKFQKLFFELLDDDGKTKFKRPDRFQDRYFRK